MSSDPRSSLSFSPSFVHLRRLTDDTGLIEHALGRIPRRREGYTTDDNARALWTATEWLDPKHASRVGEEDRTELGRLTDIYLAFMLWVQKEDGWFHNNISYDRSPEPEEVSHDCQGRSVWSCADAWIRLDKGQRETAFVLIQKSLGTIGRIDSRRGQAFAMAACAHLLEAAAGGLISLPDGWERELREHLTRLEALLTDAFRHVSHGTWRWFEPAMTYGNGVLPWAMLRAFRVTRSAETLEIGLDSLSSLQSAMTSENGGFRPIGNESWCTRDAVSHWDQQPLEMFKLALALDEAAAALDSARSEGVSLLISASTPSGGPSRSGTLTAERDEPFRLGNSTLVDPTEHAASLREARDRCLFWFHGDNDLHAPMVDEKEGCCCDGLQANGPNMNCGAEATLSYLMTKALCDRSPG